jgi:hypothetical protein
MTSGGTPLRLSGALFGALALGCAASPALADKIANPMATFAGLDKITGRIIAFDVAMDETVQFGTLQVTPRVCYSRPPTDAPQTDAFAQVDEIDDQKKSRRIFSGWMFADSPGLHGVEHPIYDVWLTACKGGTTVIHDAPVAEATPDDSALPADAADPNATPDAAQTPAPQQPKKRKPKPTVVATPTAAPAQDGGGGGGGGNAPLDLGGASAPGGNGRLR